jgi:hypothetical protein
VPVLAILAKDSKALSGLHDPSDPGGRTTNPLPPPQPGTQPLPYDRKPITPNTVPANSPWPADQSNRQ